MFPSDEIGDVLIAGTWLQLRASDGSPDFTGLLLSPVMLANKKIQTTNKQMTVWDPITSQVIPTTTQHVVKVLGRVQFPLPDRAAHLRIAPSFVKR